MKSNYPLRASIQEPSETRTATGVVTTYTEVARRWCRLSTVGRDGRARYGAAVGNRVTHQLVMRSVVVLTPERKIVIGGTAYFPVEPEGIVQGLYTTVLLREAREESVSEGSGS